jgi:uncharacterized YigZ family protein
MKCIIKSGIGILMINKSKFYSSCFEVNSVNDFELKIKDFKQQYKDASHYPFAYRIMDENKILYEKYSDDSEPFGVAGIPMLSLLKNNLIINGCLITARYFGGIKLGKGNLLGAFMDVAKAALKDTALKDIVETIRYKIALDYKSYQNLKHYIEVPEIEILNIDFGKDVIVDFSVIKTYEADIISKINSIGLFDIITINN